MSFSFTYRPYRRAFRPALRTGGGVWSVRKGILVRVSDGSGHFGLGEAAPIEGFGTESFDAALNFFKKRERTMGWDEIRDIPRELPCCRFACEEACRAYEWEVSGGPLLSGELRVAALLPAGWKAIEALPQFLKMGYSLVKWKIGVLPLDEERECFRRLMEGIPAGINVRLDANGSLTPGGAEAWIADASEAGIEFLEQPLAASESGALLDLARNCALPLALDESVAGAEDVRRWRDRGWPGLFVIKPALAGSFETFQSVVREAGAVDSLVFSSAFETGVGMKSALAWAFSLSGETSARGLGFGTGGAFGDGLSPLPSARLRWSDVEEWDVNAVWEAVFL